MLYLIHNICIPDHTGIDGDICLSKELVCGGGEVAVLQQCH